MSAIGWYLCVGNPVTNTINGSGYKRGKPINIDRWLGYFEISGARFQTAQRDRV